ncbi:MAG: hypothetical protein CTY36_01155 [Methylocystis sp.]|nr:MAG: hypothetical protein CTY36_01155 [Methylocystis sp.]
MLAFGIVFILIGLGFFCWLLFALTVHALPVFVGVTVGAAAFHSGAGAVGFMLVALVSGAVSLFAGQIAFAATRSPPLRAAIAAVFAAPAAIAGYHVAFGLAEIGASSAIWRETFAVIGAIMVGGTAWARITLYTTTNFERRLAAGLDHVPRMPAIRNR